MPVYRAASFGLLVLASLLMPGLTQADEISAIKQQVKQGNTDAALKRVNAYLNASPQNVQALFVKGLILAEQKRDEDAIRIFTEITQKHPGLPEPYNNLAVLYANQGEYDKAKRALEAALNTNSSYATAHENLGDIYAQMASEAYGKALELNGTSKRPQTRLALISDIARPTERPVLVADNHVQSKNTIAKPITPAKTSTATLPIRPAQPAKTAEVKAAPAKQAETSVPAENTDSTAADEKTITANVKQWAKAWAAQDVEKYLASYASTFEPAGGESRSDWEKLRRERVSAPASIRVDLSNLKVMLDDEKTARVKFRQAYRTGRATMRTDKLLIMKKSDGNWLIQQELTDR